MTCLYETVEIGYKKINSFEWKISLSSVKQKTKKQKSKHNDQIYKPGKLASLNVTIGLAGLLPLTFIPFSFRNASTSSCRKSNQNNKYWNLMANFGTLSQWLD